MWDFFCWDTLDTLFTLNLGIDNPNLLNNNFVVVINKLLWAIAYIFFSHNPALVLSLRLNVMLIIEIIELIFLCIEHKDMEATNFRLLKDVVLLPVLFWTLLSNSSINYWTLKLIPSLEGRMNLLKKAPSKFLIYHTKLFVK